nr:hypothetical protein [Tanacetum cinerariifolium]
MCLHPWCLEVSFAEAMMNLKGYEKGEIIHSLAWQRTAFAAIAEGKLVFELHKCSLNTIRVKAYPPKMHLIYNPPAGKPAVDPPEDPVPLLLCDSLTRIKQVKLIADAYAKMDVVVLILVYTE